MMAEANGRRSIAIREAAKAQLNIDYFKIINKLGNGAFGFVYLVSPKKQIKGGKAPTQLYAMKILEKEKVLK